MKRVAVLFLIFLAAVAVGKIAVSKNSRGISQPSPTPSSNFAPIVKSEGDVTVSVRPLVLTVGENPSFEIIMDTHSVALDFNIASVAQLTDALGKTYGPAAWKGTDPGGHHQKGTLTFSQPLTKFSEKVELTFRDIDGIPIRTFMQEVN